MKPWITNEIAPPSLDNRSRVLEGLDLAPQPPLRSRRLQPVERYAVPRSGRGGLDRSARHRAEQYRSRLRGEVDRLDRGGATDNRHDFDRLQAARRELFRIERELAY